MIKRGTELTTGMATVTDLASRRTARARREEDFPTSEALAFFAAGGMVVDILNRNPFEYATIRRLDDGAEVLSKAGKAGEGTGRADHLVEGLLAGPFAEAIHA